MWLVLNIPKTKKIKGQKLFSSLHPSVQRAPGGALFKSSTLNPEERFKVSEQHLIHINVIAEVTLKINRHKKIIFKFLNMLQSN